MLIFDWFSLSWGQFCFFWQDWNSYGEWDGICSLLRGGTKGWEDILHISSSCSPVICFSSAVRTSKVCTETDGSQTSTSDDAWDLGDFRQTAKLVEKSEASGLHFGGVGYGRFCKLPFLNETYHLSSNNVSELFFIVSVALKYLLYHRYHHIEFKIEPFGHSHCQLQQDPPGVNEGKRVLSSPEDPRYAQAHCNQGTGSWHFTFRLCIVPGVVVLPESCCQSFSAGPDLVVLRGFSILLGNSFVYW